MLAGAYASRNPKSLLTHSVEVDAQDNELRVYCGRVALENVADHRGGDPSKRPTCQRCAKHFDDAVREEARRGGLPSVRDVPSLLAELNAIPTVIIAYHGTNSGPFTQFDPARRGSATDEGLLGAGFYASTDPQVGRSSKTTLEVSVRFERPLRVEFPSWSADKSRLVNDALGTHGLRGTAITVEAERQGYDGVVLDYSPVGYRHQEVVAFDRDQIQILGPIAVRPLVTEEVAEPDLSYLLAPRGRARAIGHEDGPEPPTDGIARYRSPHGSYRYVYYVDGVAVSALQVMTRDKRHGRVANVWTAPQARRHGYATALLQQARRDLKTVEHSDDLSTDAVAWVGRVGEPLDDGTDSWEDYLAPGEARYVPAVVLPQMPDVVARAVAAGMPHGAEFMGAGMTGVVFCVGTTAFKVAREASPTLRRMLEEEAEWLAAAAAVPAVAPHVAGVRQFDPGNVVIVRDCPRADPDEPRWKWESALFDLHRRIEQAMLPNGWSAPEFKPDSYVLTSGGPILVDASMPSRVGAVLAQYVEDVARGARELGDERPNDLAFAVRREVGQTLSQAEADRLQALLARRWPGVT